MIYIRSALFNVFFYAAMVLYMLIMLLTIWLPRKKRVRFLQSFGHTTDKLLRVFTGINTEYRGGENMPEGPVIVACKHQSVWETFTVLTIVDDPAIILKRELAWIPVFGWLTILYKMINVQRGKKGAAIKSLVRGAKEVVKDGRQVIIFPEGTRRAPGAEPIYKAGLPALYSGLNVPCVPIALNSGVYWPRRKFLKYPGTIVMEICEPIAPGLPRDEFNAEVQRRIEDASNRLLDEAGWSGS